MKAYPTYKDSGIEWIGEVPEHWEVKNLKWIIKINSGGGIKSDDILPSGTYPVYGGNGITGYSEDYNYDEEILVLGRVGAYCGSVYLISGKNWVTDNALVVFANYNKEFLFYTLTTMNLNRLASKNAQPLITGTLVKNQFFASPPSNEQEKIANFLDHKTAQIDAAIEQHRRLIKLLKEHRAALINEAVTKGLPAEARAKAGMDPQVPMKDSGIEWIGEVPEHWEIKKVKYVCRIIDCKHITPKYVETGIPVVSTGNVKPEEITTDSVRMVSQDDYELLTEGGRKPKKFDIIYSRNATVGAAALVKLDNQFCLGQDVCIIRSSLNQQFLEKLLNSKFITNQLESELVGSTFRRINIGQVKEFFILVPPTNEQIQIIEYIETETTRIDEEITLAQQEIALLEEYRQSLIAEAVTGKIDVRDYPLED